MPEPVAVLSRGPGTPPPTAPRATVLRMPERPYPGLRPFEDSEAGIFFGREGHRNRLLEILRRERFLAVVGPSGSGKSSLVRAGLLPALPLGAVGTGPNWRIAIMRPGNKPLRNLAAELLKPQVLLSGLLGGLADDHPDLVDITRVETALRRGPYSLLDLVVAAKAHAACPRDNVLVLVDQFEELFTYAEAGDRQADESDAFVNLLLSARDAPQAGLFVAITMRTDFLGHCVRFLDLPEALNRAQYLTPRLSRDEIRDAVTQPAWSFGGDIQPHLVEELINAVQESADQLPVLQHALARMWELAVARNPERPNIVTEDLAAVGGVDGALAKHGEQLLGHLNAEQQLDAEWLLRAITAERSLDGGGQRVRRPQTLARIADWSGRPWVAFIPVIKLLSQSSANFVTYRGQPDEPADGKDTVLDLSHESLMRQWGTLERWVGMEADCAGEYRRLSQRMCDEKLNQGSLLTGGDLQRALAWLGRGLQLGTAAGRSGRGEPTAAWAARYDAANKERFAAVAGFIRRSDTRERLGKYTVRGLTAMVVVASVGMAWFGYSAYLEGVKSQVASLWADVRVAGSNEPLSEAAAQKVHDVSRASIPIRLRFARDGIEQPRLQPSLVAGSGLVVRSAVGLHDPLRRDLSQQLRKLSSTPERDKLIDAAVLGMLGESVFDDWKAAFVIPADQVRSSVLVAHFGAAMAVLPLVERNEWMERLLKLSRDEATGVEALPTLGTALVNAAAHAPDERVGEVVQVVHGLVKRTSDRARREALARRMAGLAKRMDAASLSALSTQLAQEAAAGSDSELLRALRTEVRAITESVSGSALRAWAEPLVTAATQAAPASRVLDSWLQPIVSRLEAEPQLAQRLLQTALTADEPTLRRQADWFVQLLAEAGSHHPELAFKLALRMSRAGLKQSSEVVENLAGNASAETMQTWRARLREETQAAKGADKALALVLRALDRGDPHALRSPPGRTAPSSSAGKEGSFATALRAVRTTSDPSELRHLASQLEQVVELLPEAAIQPAFERLLAELKVSSDSDQLEALSKGMRAFAARARAPMQARLVEQALAMLKQTTISLDQGQVIAEYLKPAIASVSTSEAAQAGKEALSALSQAAPPEASKAGVPQSQLQSDRARRQAAQRVAHWRTLLVAVSERLAKDEAALAPWTAALISGKAEAKQPASTDAISDALAATEAGQPPGRVAQVFDTLLAGLPTERQALKAAAADRVFAPVGDDTTDEDDPAVGDVVNKSTPSRGSALSRLAVRLGDAAAMERMAVVVKLPLADAGAKRLVLQGLASGRSGAVVWQMQGLLLDGMAREQHARGLKAMARALGDIVDRQPNAVRTQMAADVAKRLLSLKAGEGAAARALADLLSWLIGPKVIPEQAIRPDPVLAWLLVESCKVPYMDRSKVAIAVRRGNAEAPAASQGLWEFLRWAVKYYDIAVDTPPGLPPG